MILKLLREKKVEKKENNLIEFKTNFLMQLSNLFRPVVMHPAAKIFKTHRS